MVFSSAVFLFFFLPLVVFFDRMLWGTRLKNAWLIVASLLFYAFGQLKFVPLLFTSVILNYVCGLIAVGKHAKLGVAAAAVGGLGLLGVFKYADFFIGTLNGLAGLSIPLPGIALPAGISFFTFQGLSYVIDVYRDKTQVCRSFPKVLLYISLFPQLVAGPIIKYHDIAGELSERRTDPKETAYGIRRFVCGLSKKLLVANTVGQLADAVFGLPSGSIGMFAAWTGAVCYTLQIYFDFSGYSDMAIGIGMMLGFHFGENFNYPYAATTIQEFWRRWHISLSSWFRDYLYIPLGGNRKGRARTWLNRVIVFFITGLWHGASWNFVLWGLWHGLFSVLEGCGAVPVERIKGRIWGRIYTILVVVCGFVLFRADTVAQAAGVIGVMFTGFGSGFEGTYTVCSMLTPAFVLTLVLGLLLSFPVAKRLKPEKDGLAFCGTLVLFAICVLNLSSGGFNPFIYFRF